MAYLGKSDYLNNFDFQYKTDINNLFASTKNDSSVQFIEKVSESYHAHLSINGFFFDNNFEKDTSYLKFLHLDKFGLPNTLYYKPLIIDSPDHAVEAFADVSRFDKFVENHQGYFQLKIEKVASEIADFEMINDFETF
jgi:hypothetical protein